MEGIKSPTDTVFTIATTPIKFGIAVTDEVGYELKRLGVKKTLIVTDKNLGEIGLASKVKALIEGENVEADVYDGTHIEPTNTSIKEAVKFAKDKNYGGFVALGGGRSIDTAKAINLLTTYSAPIMGTM